MREVKNLSHVVVNYVTAHVCVYNNQVVLLRVCLFVLQDDDDGSGDGITNCSR